jgi:uncharacterized damage-inducible protein DinB
MYKELLNDMLNQNRLTCSFALDAVSEENKAFRLNKDTASVGFIHRHIGEIMNMYGQFLGVRHDVQNTTLGYKDTGKDYNLAEDKALIINGFTMLQEIIKNQSFDYWQEQVDTPFFGTVSKARIFAHILYHNSHHCGQISLTIAHGK